MTRRRLTEAQRRAEILEAARACFLEKGFTATTMEAVVEKTTLSKGGVYRYYPSTVRMLADLMKQGTRHRFDRMRASSQVKLTSQADLIEWLTEGFYQKIVDENPYKKLYALFLLEANRNEELLALKTELNEHFFAELSREGYGHSQVAEILKNEAFVEVLNALIIGVEMVGMRGAFERHGDYLRAILKTWLEKGFKDEGVTLAGHEKAPDELGLKGMRDKNGSPKQAVDAGGFKLDVI